MRIVRIGSRRWLSVAILSGAMFLALVLQLADVNPAISQSTMLTAYQVDEDPGVDPNSSVWNRSLRARIPLSGQFGVYSAGGGNIDMVTARALHFQGTLYIKVEWRDSTKDDSTARVEDFADAVALQFPAQSATSVPAVCMGQADAGVNIWQWRADFQGGIPDVLASHPNALVDGYPSNEDLFFTARAAGNPAARANAGAVQDLVSRAFGGISPALSQEVQGYGIHDNGTWSVVFARRLEGLDTSRASFAAGTRTDIAFAIWDGSQGDRNGQKAVSPFVRLSISGAAFPDSNRSNAPLVWAVGLLGAATILGIALGWYGYKEAKGR
jgi:hypothetical protein